MTLDTDLDCIRFYKEGRYSDAISCLEKIAKVDPSNAEVWYIKGLSHMELRQYNLAIRCFSLVIIGKPFIV